MSGVRLSAVVMAHPARIDHAYTLREQHPELGLRVVVDPDPGTPGGTLRTARLAWAAVAPDATHHLVLQDDTILCGAFREQLLGAIGARPGEALSFYTEWGSETSYLVRLAALCGASWAEVIDDYVPTQALVMPAAAARDFTRFPCDPDTVDDYAVRLFLTRSRMPVWMAVPNLADDARLPSLVGHDSLGERGSACFFQEGQRVDWTREARPPPATPLFSWTVGQPYTRERPGASSARWRRIPHPSPASDGRPFATVRELGRATLHQWPGSLRGIGGRLLLGLWLTGYGLGSTAAGLTGRVEPRELLRRPVVRRALASMPDGALRFLVDDALLAACRAELIELVETSVRQGFEAGTSPEVPVVRR